MSVLNAILRTVFDGLLFPFRTLPPWVGLTVTALLTAIAMLPVVKATSNQQGMEAIKRQMSAGWFEIRLFNDDLRAIMRAQMELLWSNLKYLGLWLVPMLWLFIPFGMVAAQLQFHYGYHGLEPGQQALVKVQLKEGAQQGTWAGAGSAEEGPKATLEVPEGLRVETPAVWIPSLGELGWRIAAESWGDYEIAVEMGGESWSKSVRVSEDVVRRSPIRVGPSFLDMVLYPAEDPLPADSPIESITVTYSEDGNILFLPRDLWMIPWIVLIILFAFALKSRFDVTI
ncbi:MAG: hypothetical protein WBH75_14625 [Thermoanaerobaculia bacterium]